MRVPGIIEVGLIPRSDHRCTNDETFNMNSLQTVTSTIHTSKLSFISQFLEHC
jgi:hypothetical protein